MEKTGNDGIPKSDNLSQPSVVGTPSVELSDNFEKNIPFNETSGVAVDAPLQSREELVTAREDTAHLRESAAGLREDAINIREDAAQLREGTATSREE